jgi:hypothetical protein
MAATALTPIVPQKVTGVSVAGAACDTSNGNSYPAACVLLVRNTGVGSRTVTVTTPADADGNVVADPTVAVASGAVVLIGPLDPARYGSTVTATGNHAELFFTAIQHS